MPETPPFELFQLGTEGDPALLNWLMLQSGTIANRPAASADINGAAYLATDEGRIYRIINGAWVLLYTFAVSVVDFQRFTSSGTWSKPNAASWIFAELIGGGGAGIATSTARGGLPGRVVRKLFRASDLSNSESVTVASGGGTSAFGAFRALGGTDGEGIGNNPITQFLRNIDIPGRGGSSRNETIDLVGQPGEGLSSVTAAGQDGADSSTGTGSGGGGSVTTSGGDGGIPGGGGGSCNSGSTPGNGARGEARIWSW